MLMRTDPYREIDRLAQQVFGTTLRPAAMPMNAYRKDDTFYVKLDLPGIDMDAIELTVEQNVLTLRAERRGVTPDDNVELIVSECPAGVFTRQIFVGDTLDTEQIDADYAAGILTLSIPVREAAKPRRVEVTNGDTRQPISA